MNPKTHWKKLKEADLTYLGSWDFQPGEERTLTIARVSRAEVFNPPSNKNEMRTILHFAEKSKPMVLNGENGKRISKLAGSSYVEDWPGIRITLVVEKFKAFGELMEGLRVSKTPPKAAPKQTNTQPHVMPPQPTKVSDDPTIVSCIDCDGPIVAHGDYTAKQVEAANWKRYGEPLCAKCSTLRREAEKEEASDAAES